MQKTNVCLSLLVCLNLTTSHLLTLRPQSSPSAILQEDVMFAPFFLTLQSAPLVLLFWVTWTEAARTDGNGRVETERWQLSLRSQSGFRQWLDGCCRIRWHESSVVHCSLCNDLFVQLQQHLHSRLLKSRPLNLCHQLALY